MGNGSDHMDNNKVTNKPCDTCCTNIQRAVDCDEVNCFEDCCAFQEWRDERLKHSDIGQYRLDHVPLANRRQLSGGAGAVVR